MSKLHLLVILIFFSITTHAQKKPAWYAASDLGWSVNYYQEENLFSEPGVKSAGLTNTLGVGKNYFLGKKSSVGAELLFFHTEILIRSLYNNTIPLRIEGFDYNGDPILVPIDSLSNGIPLNIRNYRLGFAIPIYYKYSFKKLEIGGGMRASFPLLYDKEQGKTLDHIEIGYQLLMTCELNDSFKIRMLAYNSLSGIKNKSTGQLFIGLSYYW